MEKMYSLKMEVHWYWHAKIVDQEKAKEALESYNDIIESDSDLEAMLQHIAWNVGLRGTLDVEGVGHVRIEGRAKSPYAQFEDCGIELIKVYEEDAEFEVEPLKVTIIDKNQS